MTAYVLLFFAMIFAHIFADYNLQGILAMMKQQSWWANNAPQELYRHDYISALIEHSMSWACVVCAPAIAFNYHNLTNANGVMLIVFTLLFSTALHAFIDHVKANWKTMSLCVDQLIHFVQILSIYWSLVLCPVLMLS